jgi:hypothetical protein
MSSGLQWILRVLPAIAVASAAFGQTAAALPPIDGQERVKWLTVENLAPGGLLETVAIGAWQTHENTPKEYGPHWTGFAERTGLITANYGVKSTMEVGLGSIWGEDPRYDQTEGQSLGHRLGHVIKMTFLARDRNGKTMPAYSRYIAIPGSSFLANQWLPDSQATNSDAAVRAGLGFLSRMAENAYKEFIARRH